MCISSRPSIHKAHRPLPERAAATFLSSIKIRKHTHRIKGIRRRGRPSALPPIIPQPPQSCAQGMQNKNITGITGHGVPSPKWTVSLVPSTRTSRAGGGRREPTTLPRRRRRMTSRRRRPRRIEDTMPSLGALIKNARLCVHIHRVIAPFASHFSITTFFISRSFFSRGVSFISAAFQNGQPRPAQPAVRVGTLVLLDGVHEISSSRDITQGVYSRIGEIKKL